MLRSRIAEKQIFHFLFYVFSFKFQKKIKIKGVQAKSVCSQFSRGSPKKRAAFEYSSTDREARCNLCKMSLNEPLNMAPNYKLFCTSSGSINAEKRLLSKVSLTLNQSLQFSFQFQKKHLMFSVKYTQVYMRCNASCFVARSSQAQVLTKV